MKIPNKWCFLKLLFMTIRVFLVQNSTADTLIYIMFVTEVMEMLHKMNISINSLSLYQWVFQIVWPISHKCCKTYIHYFQESGFSRQYVIKSLPSSLFIEITKTGFKTLCSTFFFFFTIRPLALYDGWESFYYWQ